jgi:hypothetical protein
VPVASIERGTDEAPAETTRMTELLRYTRHDGMPHPHLTTVGH